MTRQEDRRKKTLLALVGQYLPFAMMLIIAWFALRERVTVSETKLANLPERMNSVEGRVSVIESRQELTIDMLKEMRGDIKTLIREEN